MVTMDWLGKMLNLPECFLFCSGGQGGGVIQGTASESTLVTLLAARTKAIEKVRTDRDDPGSDGEIMSRLVAYCSDQAHSSVERSGLLSAVRLVEVKTDHSLEMNGASLRQQIESDLKRGLIPFYVCATVGSTQSCAFDKLSEIGPVCQEFGLWLHVDAAYAGSACICPEFRYLINGIEFADSFNFNPHKWLLVNFDCSCLWLRDSNLVVQAFNVDPLYLKHDHQEYIRKDVRLAKKFEELVKSEDKFEIFYKTTLGLVCFRLKQSNEANEELLRRINKDGRIHLVPSKAHGTYFLRFAVCSRFSTETHIDFAWKVIAELAGDC